jgi:hypothetical protein
VEVRYSRSAARFHQKLKAELIAMDNQVVNRHEMTHHGKILAVWRETSRGWRCSIDGNAAPEYFKTKTQAQRKVHGLLHQSVSPGRCNEETVWAFVPRHNDVKWNQPQRKWVCRTCQRSSDVRDEQRALEELEQYECQPVAGGHLLPGCD